MLKSEFKIAVIDTETTGLDPEKDHVIEVAIISVTEDSIGQGWTSFIRSPVPIPPETSAVHHIIDSDLKDAPLMETISKGLEKMLEDAVLVAHNANFDRSFLPFLGKNSWICSLRLARHLWPELPNHTNQTLKYCFGFDLDLPRGKRIAHSALEDAKTTAKIFQLEMQEAQARFGIETIEGLIELSNSPIRVDVINFGKHKGTKVADLPKDYVRWLLNNTEDTDLRYTLTAGG